MMVAGDTYTAETARYCLLSLRHGNVRNQADIIASIRANPGLVKNVRCACTRRRLAHWKPGPSLGPRTQGARCAVGHPQRTSRRTQATGVTALTDLSA